MRPRPCLPVDSVSSCSSQAPNARIGADNTQRDLVPPGQREPAERGGEPQHRDGRAAAAPVGAGSRPWPRHARASAPGPRRSSAAGTRPKSDSAEKRPPMSGALRNVRRKRPSAARRASGVPASVMATKCAPALAVSRFDLGAEEAVQREHLGRRARLRGHQEQRVGELESLARRPNRAGIRRVEHASAPGRRSPGGKVAASTSAARLEPPMPRRTAS